MATELVLLVELADYQRRPQCVGQNALGWRWDLVIDLLTGPLFFLNTPIRHSGIILSRSRRACTVLRRLAEKCPAYKYWLYNKPNHTVMEGPLSPGVSRTNFESDQSGLVRLTVCTRCVHKHVHMGTGSNGLVWKCLSSVCRVQPSRTLSVCHTVLFWICQSRKDDDYTKNKSPWKKDLKGQ